MHRDHRCTGDIDHERVLERGHDSVMYTVCDSVAATALPALDLTFGHGFNAPAPMPPLSPRAWRHRLEAGGFHTVHLVHSVLGPPRSPTSPQAQAKAHGADGHGNQPEPCPEPPPRIPLPLHPRRLPRPAFLASRRGWARLRLAAPACAGRRLRRVIRARVHAGRHIFHGKLRSASSTSVACGVHKVTATHRRATDERVVS